MTTVKSALFESATSLRSALRGYRDKGLSVGFVPTMGALHAGHLSLVKKAQETCDIVVVSIFVNPTQFNNPTDLEKYPRMLEQDLITLGEHKDLLVFAPDYSEVYPEGEQFAGIDLRGLDKVMEGQFRPGHFQGVVHVVRNLFRIVQPDKAFFGMKDFQQVAVIRHMVSTLNLPIEIIACPTLREENGLAMSSRNMLLSDKEREEALIISRTLFQAREWRNSLTPREVAEQSLEFLSHGKLEVEYLQIVDGDTLKPLTNDWAKNSVMCIAAYCGPVRLIDNLELN